MMRQKLFRIGGLFIFVFIVTAFLSWVNDWRIFGDYDKAAGLVGVLMTLMHMRFAYTPEEREHLAEAVMAQQAAPGANLLNLHTGRMSVMFAFILFFACVIAWAFKFELLGIDQRIPMLVSLIVLIAVLFVPVWLKKR